MAAVEPPAVEPAGPVGPAPAPAPAPGVLDLYRAVWDALRGTIARHQIAIALEIALVAIWFLLRTRYGVESRPYLVWTVVAAGVALISPASGLVLLAATGPFFEPVTIGGDLGMRHLLVVILGISVVIRLVAGGWRRMPWSPPVILAIAIGALTALGVVNTYQGFDRLFAEHAARSWLSSVGGAMVILLVATWAARDGTWRPFAAALGAAVVAGLLSLIDHFATGAIATGPLAWIGFWKDFNGRMGGAVPSPNGMGALLIVPTAVLIFWGVLHRGRWAPRAAALLLAVPLVVALYVTYSRAALLALFIVAVVLGWRVRRPLGVAILAVGIAGGAILLPGYLQLRSQSALEGGVTAGSILVASDEYRFRAWDAASKMWLDQPLVGHGFLAYRQLGPAYGDPVLGSPHNEWLRLFAEEGTVGGLVGLGFVATTLWRLARRKDAISGGILAGIAGYFLMASFNNPFLFIQISAVVFVALGYGLARARRQPADAAEDAPSPADAPSPEDAPRTEEDPPPADLAPTPA